MSPRAIVWRPQVWCSKNKSLLSEASVPMQTQVPINVFALKMPLNSDKYLELLEQHFSVQIVQAGYFVWGGVFYMPQFVLQ